MEGGSITPFRAEQKANIIVTIVKIMITSCSAECYPNLLFTFCNVFGRLFWRVLFVPKWCYAPCAKYSTHMPTTHHWKVCNHNGFYQLLCNVYPNVFYFKQGTTAYSQRSAIIRTSRRVEDGKPTPKVIVDRKLSEGGYNEVYLVSWVSPS